MTLTLERPQPGQADTTTLTPRRSQRRARPEKVAAGLTLVVLVTASVVSLISVDISLPQMIASWSNATRFFDRVGIISFPAPGELLYLTALTVGLVLLGTLFAAVFSVPLAWLAAANTSPGRGWMVFARFLGVAIRAVPDVVLAMVFVLMFSLGTLPGILAIGIHSIGMISKMFADAIEQIDDGPRLAIRAAGATRLQEFFSGVLPQVLPSWVATVLHRNDINLRGSVILGYVGVAGLGLEMSYAFKSLNYSLGLGIAVVIFALCVVMEIVSSAVRTVMLGFAPTRHGIGDRLLRRIGVTGVTADASHHPWTYARIRNAVWGTLAALIVIGSIWICDIKWGDILTFWSYLPETAAKFWPPSFGAYDAPVMLAAMGETIAIALAATILTLLASIVIGSLAARNVAPNPRVRAGFRLVLVTIRGIPEIILAIVLIVVTGLGTQAGTIALAIGGIGLLGKLLADSLEEVRPGPEQALRAAGATRLQVYAGATAPQGMKALIGHSFYMLDTNIRAATILGLVGGGGVGYYLLNAGQGSRYDLVTTIVLMILVTVIMVEGLAVWMRRVFR
ncbi:ABC transporter permease [Cryobacterium sp. Y29]|uniref:PhnE/PtxC family ABC transporter permease n=1 Tax=Cryobacterium sp. Y29 TaxID=2048285 RepID=UPI001E575E5C|nr:ABC transporter permease subunit [Cryobacterium sp. Y29]